jgi:hypothetical protein
VYQSHAQCYSALSPTLFPPCTTTTHTKSPIYFPLPGLNLRKKSNKRRGLSPLAPAPCSSAPSSISPRQRERPCVRVSVAPPDPRPYSFAPPRASTKLRLVNLLLSLVRSRCTRDHIRYLHPCITLQIGLAPRLTSPPGGIKGGILNFESGLRNLCHFSCPTPRRHI